MREICADTIGSLVSFRGIIVKCSDARPSARVICYSCEACGFEAYQTVSGRECNPLIECPSQKCVKNNIKGKLLI